MAEISKITLPTGAEYSLKDETARASITTETSRATSAEQTNAANIISETSRATAAEAALETEISDTKATLESDIIEGHGDSELPTLCGQPSILFGTDTPQEAVVPLNWKQYDPLTDEGYMWNGEPCALGQQYININATSGGRYIACPKKEGSAELVWKNF